MKSKRLYSYLSLFADIRKAFFLVIFLYAFIFPRVFGQERNDTIWIDNSLTQPLTNFEETQQLNLSLPNIELAPDLGQNSGYSGVSPTIPFELFPKGSYLPHWSTGYMYGSHQYAGSLFYGYTANAQAGVLQNLGEYWTVDASISLNKYSIYYNTVTLGGSIEWHPSKYFSMTAFGMYSPGSFMSPMHIGPAFQWGGYATFQTDTDVPFGIDMGARDSYDPMFGHYVAPIVQPFVKIGGAKLGIDFGPAIRNAFDRSKSHPHGPGMIPQPIKAIPQVAPRN